MKIFTTMKIILQNIYYFYYEFTTSFICKMCPICQGLSRTFTQIFQRSLVYQLGQSNSTNWCEMIRYELFSVQVSKMLGTISCTVHIKPQVSIGCGMRFVDGWYSPHSDQYDLHRLQVHLGNPQIPGTELSSSSFREKRKFFLPATSATGIKRK